MSEVAKWYFDTSIKILGKREELCYDLAMINNVNRMVQICL